MINNYPKVLNVTKHSDEQISLDIIVGTECEFFKGHFDDQAVLPGIGQIDFAIKMASEQFGIDMYQFNSIPQAKFKKVVVPNDSLTLYLTKKANVVSFEYRLQEEQVSLGKLKYAEA
jgi:3-hydroxymyristoyl/3-hydroxydecanoyl-(acyl carrier protein) dehydratase